MNVRSLPAVRPMSPSFVWSRGFSRAGVEQ